MILFHGSNVSVQAPRIIVSNHTLDFGPGFYTTSNLPQAVKWAKVQTLRRRCGSPTVTIYEYSLERASQLRVKRFTGADGEWLHYVSENRKGNYVGPKFDIVIGPVANDNTMPVINDFVAGHIDEETALILLKPQKLSDQYVFLTQKGLSALAYQEVKLYE